MISDPVERLGASDFAELCEAAPGDLEHTIHPLLGGSGGLSK